MSTSNEKKPVRIVCPHCRRAYVIEVDLQRKRIALSMKRLSQS